MLDARRLAGSRHRFDEAAAREFVARDLRRTTNPESLVNHGMLTGARIGRAGSRRSKLHFWSFTAPMTH